MRLYKRLLLITPFVLLTAYYIKHRLRTDGCNGFVEVFFYLILFFLIALSLILCVIAITRKNKKPERISLTITLLTILTLIATISIGDKIYGRPWIVAHNINDRHQVSRQRITLRSNKTFRYDLIGADYSCFGSGSFSIKGDTLNLDKETIHGTEGKFSIVYLLTGKFLIPVMDSKNMAKTYDTLLIEK